MLALDRVGVHDNFFQVGGDSIRAIQAISRANRAGMKFTPQQLFERQTIAELALLVDEKLLAPTSTPAGPIPLTPYQQSWLEQDPASRRFEAVALLEARQPLDLGLLQQTAELLLERHESLRLRIERGESGWVQTITGIEAAPKEGLLSVIDLPADNEAAGRQTIESTLAEMQTSLGQSLGHDACGPLLRLALFNTGHWQSQRLLIVAHPLAVDAAAWRVLLADFLECYQQFCRGQSPLPVPYTNSFRTWAERLSSPARTDELRAESAYWLANDRQHIRPLLREHAGNKQTDAAPETVRVFTGDDDTEALLQEISKVHRASIDDLVLTALTQSMADFNGVPELLVDVEGRGRECFPAEGDWSRTVGCFQVQYPLRLQVVDESDPIAALRIVKQQRASVPYQGASYGVLRSQGHDPQVGALLQAMPAAQVRYRWRESLREMPPSEALSLAPEFSQRAHTRLASRDHLIEITAQMVAGRLRLDWTFATGAYRRSTIERVSRDCGERLQALIDCCRTSATAGLTPLDFPAARLSQRELDSFMAKVKRNGVRRAK